MTNTKFRKRALLSSVAMLLVALVALGSATFAWFAANPDADATGLSVKTTASTGLVVSSDTNLTWSHHTTLAADVKDVQPVSLAQESNPGFLKIAAKSSGEHIGSDKATDVYGPAATDDYYSEKVYFRLSDGTAASESKTVYLKKVTISATSGASMSPAVRVSVVDKAGTIIGNYAPATVTNKTVPSSENGKAYDATKLVAFSPAVKNAAAGVTDSAVAATEVKLASADKTKYVTVYIWLDGEDQTCFSDAAVGQNIEKMINSVQLDFSLNP